MYQQGGAPGADGGAGPRDRDEDVIEGEFSEG
jgi:hypothetical protein